MPFRLIPQALLLIFAMLLVLKGSHPQRSRRFGILFIALIALDIGWVDWELLAPQSEAALIAPDALITFLSSAFPHDERIFAPFGRFPEVAAIVDNLHTADGYD